MGMWRKQLLTLYHLPRIVIVEPIFTGLEAGNDRMPCCRRMLGRMLARRTVAGTDVPTLRTPTEMKPPAFWGRLAFDTPIATRRRGGVDSAPFFFHFQFSFRVLASKLGFERVPSQRPKFGTASSTDLARDLAQVVPESIFDISRLVESARHQGFDPVLGGRSTERSDARIPPGTEFDVRREAGVDETLGLSDRPFIELGDPGRERLYERIQIGVRQGAINVTVSLRLICSDVFRAQEHFEGAVSADESGQPGHRAPAGDHPHAHLPLRDMAFSRLAKLMSHARVISLPLPVARPRMRAMEATGRRARRARKSGQGGKPVGPSGIPVKSSIFAVKSE